MGRETGMRFGWITVAVLAAGCGAVAARAQQPAAPAAPAQAQSNPFPEDTSAVPVVPTRPAEAPAAPPAYEEEAAPAVPMSGEDRDPARSPDDPAVEETETAGESSSSLKGIENLIPTGADAEEEQKKGRFHRAPPPPKPEKKHSNKEVAAEDIGVANYYLERKNWQGAMSRFESAMVMDPENPDVYFGLAVAEQHLGRMASARANYEKVALYDPDSKQGKEARKALKDPAVANGVDPKSVEKPQEPQQ